MVQTPDLKDESHLIPPEQVGIKKGEEKNLQPLFSQPKEFNVHSALGTCLNR